MTQVSTGQAQTFTVKTNSGQDLDLQSSEEQKFYNDAKNRYTTDNKFDVASDLRTLDRLVFLETLMYRWQKFLASGRDYDGFLSPSQEEQTRKNIKETAPLVSQIQSDLGLTKSQREKDQHESVGAYIAKLQTYAKAHGVRREKQLTTALDLINQLFTLVGAYRRSNTNEREKLDIENAEQILDWIEDYMRPEYEAVDQYFREHDQKFWVGTL